MAKTGTRAANGMGTIRRRADGRWEGRYTGADGRQHSVYGKTQKATAEALRAATHSVDAGSWLQPSRMTVKGWLNAWLSDYQADTAQETISKYRCIFDKHFVPVIGAVKLADLGDVHVQRALASLRRASLADSTIKNYMGIFCAALNQAQRAKLMKTNPVAGITVSGAPKKQFHVIDRKDYPAFFAAVKSTRYPVELAFLLLTGLRAGELRGLRWIDVDLDVGTLNIRQQIKQSGRVAPPKFNSTRLFHIPVEAVALLKQQRKRQAGQRFSVGAKWSSAGEGLVFTQPNGRPHGDHTIAYALRAVGTTLGVPDLHPHDLRHSYAVALLRAGVDVKTVQHNLGHATSKMTLDVYAAYTQDAGQQGASRLSDYLQGVSI